MYENITISVPSGTTLQNNHTFCVPSKWTHIAAFFLANYVTHAATVKSLPGEPTVSYAIAIFFALLFPGSGVMRAVLAIRQCTVFHCDLLIAATRAGALCMVVPTEKRKPQNGERLPWFKVAVSNARAIGARVDTFYPSNGAFSSSGRIVHGTCCLPKGYGLKMVPSSAVVYTKGSITPSYSHYQFLIAIYQVRYDRLLGRLGSRLGFVFNHSKPSTAKVYPKESYSPISSSYSLPQSLLAILQVFYASYTLYQTRGDQLEKYGYAAFGLTVAPYLVMSVLNLFSSTLTPDYASVFLVESDIMEEAKREGGKFEGTVGILVEKGGHGADIDVEGRRTIPRLQGSEGKGSPAPAAAADLVSSLVDDEGLGPVPIDADTQSPSGLSNPSINLVPAVPPIEESGSTIFGFEYFRIFFRTFIELDEFSDMDMLIALSTLLLGGASLGIVGGISHFDSGGSTLAQRVWTMMWLVVGVFLGPSSFIVLQNVRNVGLRHCSYESLFFAFFLVYAAPAIGGFVVVGEMLRGYGTCYSTY